MDDAENLKGLGVSLRSCSPDEAGHLLGELGRLKDEHVWLDIARLRALSPLAGDPDWLAGFDGVMAYAATRGWIDDSGARVRAHLVD